MDKYSFVIEGKEAGNRLDQVLTELMEDCSRSYIQKLFGKGHIVINGKRAKEGQKKYKVKIGDEIEIEIPEDQPLNVEEENIPLDIIYEDEDVLVVNKPLGMVVHPGPGNYNGTLVNGIMYHCKGNLSSINGVIRPGIVHRIDKDTTGIIMVAKNDATHRSLSEQLKNHTIKRIYEALVYNNIKEDEGVVDKPLGRDPQNRFRRAVVTQDRGKRAITHYKVMERLGKYTLVECQLETGRTHQIRAHMAYIKHPLVGDLVYGPKKTTIKREGQMLHAKTLGFIHPRTGNYMEFSVEPPKEFLEVLNKARRLIV